MTLVLASRSPQRRAILETLGVPFAVRPVDVVEEDEGAPVAVGKNMAPGSDAPEPAARAAKLFFPDL